MNLKSISKEIPNKLIPFTLGLILSICIIFIFISIYFNNVSLLGIFPITMIGFIIFMAIKKSNNILFILLLIYAGWILRHEEGFGLIEACFFALYFSYCIYYLFQQYLKDRTIVLHRIEILYICTLFWLFLAIPRALLFTSLDTNFFAESLPLSALIAYFPIRDYILRYKSGFVTIIAILIFWGVLCGLRNILEYREILATSKFLWKIQSARVVANESQLLLGALLSLYLCTTLKANKLRIILFTAFCICFSALILTQSRGYWVAFLLCFLILLFMTKPKLRVKLLSRTIGLLCLCILLIYSLLGHKIFMLSASNIIQRFDTLSSATTSDISLLSRFYEADHVSNYSRLNPIIGYGPGAKYLSYDIITNTTILKSVIHNGYYSLVYKYGFIGFFLNLSTLGLFIFIGIRHNFRKHSVQHQIGTVLVTSIIGLLPTISTSNQFYFFDQILFYSSIYAVLMALTFKNIVNGKERPN